MSDDYLPSTTLLARPMSPMLVVGLDPSLTGTGIALPGDRRTFTSTRTGGSWKDRRLRYLGLLARVLDAIESHPAFEAGRLLVCIEGYAFSRNGAGHADSIELGLILRDRLSARYGVDAIAEVGPSTLKLYATGKGNAPKGDLRMALYKRTGIDERDADRVDAEWLRLLGLDAIGAPEVEVPAAHRRALNAVTWPEPVAALRSA